MRGRGARLGVVVAVAVTGVSGCSALSDPSPSTEVDEPVVLTPSPDPADFVDVVTDDEVSRELSTRGVGLDLVTTTDAVVLACQVEGE